MAEARSGNSGMAFILGGVVVALALVIYVMSGGSLFGIGGETTHVAIETPTLVVPEGGGSSSN